MLEIRLLPALRREDERRITMIIRKKKLKEYIERLKQGNRAEKLGQNYNPTISEKQKNMNIYLQGYEDGTDNFFNAICHKFKL